MENELYHHGVKGMKWGIRRTPAQLGHKTSSKKSSKKSSSESSGKPGLFKRKAKEPAKTSEQEAPKKKKKVSEMTDAELKERIGRLELEKKYRDLAKSTSPQKSKGRQFAERVVERAGENVATQFTTYVLGTGVNKAFANVFNDPKIINPKKGQKD